MADFDMNNFMGMDISGELNKLLEKAKKIQNGERAYTDEENERARKEKEMKTGMRKAASGIHEMYDAFAEAGFSDEQAFLLTVECLRRSR